MSLAARARYLIAMGLLPPVSACQPDAPTQRVPAVTAPPAITAPATPPPVVVADIPATPPVVRPLDPAATPPAVPPTEPTILRRDAGGGAWIVETVVPRDLPTEPRPSCPSGTFCVPAPGVAIEPAPPPHVDCDASVSHAASASPTAQFDAVLTASERTLRADACCYSWYIPCPGGRPLRAEGVPLLAASAARSDWSTRPGPAARIDPATRERLATHWLAEAAAEHASIAAFGRFSLQLLALAAPPELVSAAHTAALDEIRHARQCYALAARYSGEQRGPGALQLPGGALPSDPATVALETLRDGCLGESLAARAVAQAAAAAADPYVARILVEIAADEENHAALAWQAVAWLVRTHPEPVRPVIEAFLAALSAPVGAPDPALQTPIQRIDDHDDRSFGVLTRAQHLAVREQTVAEIVIPCLRALLHADSA